MTIKAEVILDSVSPQGIRLTTFQVRYHRYAHAELMTHGLFNRNASSSRAIPVSRLIDDIERDPALPLEWGKNQKGMQAHSQLEGAELATAKALWNEDREHSILMARAMIDTNAAKQIVNRLVENHGHINVIITASEYANFFHVRNHRDALPEIRELARQMQFLHTNTTPDLVAYEGWHLPYITEEDRGSGLDKQELILVSTARCARVSYLTHDMRKPALEDDLRLAHDLVSGDPKHASPAGHQGTPLPTRDFFKNVRGWAMHRAYIPGEAVWDAHNG